MKTVSFFYFELACGGLGQGMRWPGAGHVMAWSRARGDLEHATRWPGAGPAVAWSRARGGTEHVMQWPRKRRVVSNGKSCGGLMLQSFAILLQGLSWLQGLAAKLLHRSLAAEAYCGRFLPRHDPTTSRTHLRDRGVGSQTMFRFCFAEPGARRRVGMCKDVLLKRFLLAAGVLPKKS